MLRKLLINWIAANLTWRQFGDGIQANRAIWARLAIQQNITVEEIKQAKEALK